MPDLPSLSALALAALGRLVPAPAGDAPAEVQFLHAHASRLAPEALQPAALLARLRSPEGAGPLERVAHALDLTLVEALALGLLFAVESDSMAGRSVAFLQAPLGGSRPTVALVARAFGDLHGGVHDAPALAALVTGAAAGSGLFQLLQEDAPLPERSLALPLHLFFALSGQDAAYPTQSATAGADPPLPLPPSVHAEARRLAIALRSEPRSLLLVRSSSPLERRAAARAVAAALDRRALFLEGESTAGLAPLLLLRGLLPVFCFDLGPGDRKPIPPIPGYTGPIVALAGPDGVLDTGGRSALRWSLRVPHEEERRDLWLVALGPEGVPLAEALAADHRHGAARIAELGRLARQSAILADRPAVTREDVTIAARNLEGAGLAGLAELLSDDISDQALVLAPSTAHDLEALLARCKGRDRLVAGLGASARARYRFGVRALFVGPSGTGKTLAAGWLATRLGLPLYRVDLAAVTSKYIGETEKNLAQILAHAEHAEVILLFDEADSLFAKRTDVRDANDRFANAQTNYLLQRIESFDGITLLTSNSRARFDEAFTRRLDVIVEFPHPTPAERRKLWLSHAGEGLDERAVNHLASALDLAGGHVRNIVLAAAVLARSERRPLRLSDVLAGVEAECRKLGKPVPPELRRDLRDRNEP